MTVRLRIHPQTQPAPCGDAGALQRVYTRRPVDLSDCLVSVRTPKQLTIWEPLPTKAPGPHLTWIWCCYIQTVMFYALPLRSRGPHPYRSTVDGRFRWEREGRELITWDRVDTRLAWDDLVRVDGRTFELTGGSVRWAGRRWWSCRGAREAAPRPVGELPRTWGLQA